MRFDTVQETQDGLHIGGEAMVMAPTLCGAIHAMIHPLALETVQDDTLANTRNGLLVFPGCIITDHAQRFVCGLCVRPDCHASGCGVACQNIEPVDGSCVLYLRDVILSLVLEVWLSVEGSIC